MRRSSLRCGLVAGLLATTLLTGCGDETVDGSPDDGTVADAKPTPRSALLAGDPLDLAEIASALLSMSNLPGFTDLGPSSPDEAPPADDGRTGCESDVSFEDRFDRGRLAASTSEVSYIYNDDQRLLIVSEVVASFANDEEAEFAVAALADDLDDCTHFEETVDGETSTMDLENDDETSDGADQQFNTIGTGLFTAPDYEDLEAGFGFTAARVDNSVTLTQLISLGYAADSELHLPYADIAIARLASVVAGETPTDEAGPTPDAIPRSRVPVAAGQATLEQYLAVEPRFALPD